MTGSNGSPEGFRDRVAQGVLVADGAMGTVLHAAGNPLERSLPELNLSDPDQVQRIHDSYLATGVELIQTNTFGASRLRLEVNGLGDRTAEINMAGVRVARAAGLTLERTGERSLDLVAGNSVAPA